MEYSQLLDDARADYHRSKIENSDQTKLFLVIDELIGEKKSSSKNLPDHDESMKLAESFNEIFCDKINRLRHDLDSHVLPSSGDVTNEPRCDCLFTDFEPVTAESLTLIIHSMKSKSCSLDPMPTHLLTLCLLEIDDHPVNT